MKKRIFYTFAYLALIAVVVVFAFGGVQNKSLTQKDISSSEFTTKLQQNEFAYVLVVNESTAYCITKENANNVDLTQEHDKLTKNVQKKYEYKASVTFSDELEKKLIAAQENDINGFKYDTQYVSAPWYIEFLPYIFLLLIIGVTIFFFASQSAGNGKAMQFGRSTAKLYDDSKKKITFNDVAGADEEKEELEEIVGFLKNPNKYTKMGARIPKGVLLVGPPGTGKTLLAKSVAGEAGVPFFSITGSDFVELYVGIGAARVRDLFNQAKKNSPCIIFIDEIDAVGRRRGSGIGGGHDEREQTLNQLLVEMDGFVGNEGIIIMAATNRADILDPALLRSGRFDRQIHVLPPDAKGREEIFNIHARNKKFASDVSAKEVSLLTTGFVGADIQNLCNEAALLAVRRDHEEITMQDIKDSITRVMMGPEKRSHKISAAQRKLVAYHEAGHAIVARSLQHCDPVSEVSIIPRGGAGGYTLIRPDEESETYSRLYILDRITMSLGGRAAEKLILGDVSTGASSDIKHVTELAKGYVTKYGMYEDIGPIYLGDNGGDEIFIGRDFATQKGYSEELCAKVDAAIADIIKTADKKAFDILTEKRVILDNLAEVLLDMEKISGQQFEDIFNGKTLSDFKSENTDIEQENAQEVEE
ncbi:MAG: ATP-dependent zinc metalloprotease FtsH [Clostridiales bacterium]|nr:ATP-dependent zinc metalloprotease FtsH [Clostridiales bacterium]